MPCRSWIQRVSHTASLLPRSDRLVTGFELAWLPCRLNESLRDPFRHKGKSRAVAGEHALYAPDLEMLACGDKGDMPIRDGVSIRHRVSAQIAIPWTPCARRGGVGRRRVQTSYNVNDR